ncbi:MAG: hypothetical protein GYB67_17610, partial [Chloroflexi bacterium]|nr:hypothetical protein [Chloroflexota bacterium]
ASEQAVILQQGIIAQLWGWAAGSKQNQDGKQARQKQQTNFHVKIAFMNERS